MTCDLAVEQKTIRPPAIINLINQLVEPVIDGSYETLQFICSKSTLGDLVEVLKQLDPVSTKLERDF